MRLLVTFAGGRGHLEPLLPLADAARSLGHDVAIAGAAGFASSIRRRGYPFFPIGDLPSPQPRQRIPLARLDLDKEDRDLRGGFARRLGHRHAKALLTIADEWRPDVFLRDEADFGAAVAGERLGLPVVTVLVMASGAFVRPWVVAEPLHELRAEHGLPHDPELAMLCRDLVLCPFPPSLRDPEFALPSTGRSFRGVDVVHRAVHAGRPSIYFTLGTVFSLECGDLFERVLAGLAALDVDVVATVGNDIDPAEFGPQRDGIRVERFVPQAAVLPMVDVMISHGGSGGMLGALAHGVPQVLVPLGADQPYNSARAAALGLARVLEAVDATPADVADAVHDVLTDPTYRRRAEDMRDELAIQPTPAAAISWITTLAP